MYFQNLQRSPFFCCPGKTTISLPEMIDNRLHLMTPVTEHLDNVETPAINCQSISVACELCGKSFYGINRKFLLNRHKITHTDRRPYKCPSCPYRANVSSNLLRHVRTVHPSIGSAETLSELSNLLPSSSICTDTRNTAFDEKNIN